MEKRNQLIVRIILGTLILLWMGFIFYMSSQTGDESTVTSGGIIALAEKAFFKTWSTLPSKQYMEHHKQLAYFIRKIAHFTEFFILGGLCAGFFRTFKFQWKFCFIFPAVIGILYACSDEYHQSFIAGRAMQSFDVCVDSAGVILGALTVLGIVAMCILGKRKKDQGPQGLDLQTH